MAEHTDRGWRKALYCALSDGTSMPVHQKVTLRRKGSPASEPQDMDLFKLLNP
jgi:hypothetical protein